VISLNIDIAPVRAEIWLVNLNPTIGSEIRKTRPVVVISVDSIGKLPIKLIAPLTDWKPHFSLNPWQVQVEPDSNNGLVKTSAIDVLQLRGVDVQRFDRKLGILPPEIMREINLAIALVVDFD
jgi:mRNA interferase MazF